MGAELSGRESEENRSPYDGGGPEPAPPSEGLGRDHHTESHGEYGFEVEQEASYVPAHQPETEEERQRRAHAAGQDRPT